MTIRRRRQAIELAGKRLEAAGYRVIDVTWRELVDDPTGVVARVAEALGMSLF
jgi:LPS sulfotransferase NodH